VNDTARAILESELQVLARDLDRLNEGIRMMEKSLERDRKIAADTMTRIVDINEALGKPLLTVPA